LSNAVICFIEDMFEFIWYASQVSKDAQRHKLSEAGLTPTNRIMCGTKRRRFWVREGWQLVNNNDVKRYLFNKDNSKHVWLIDDLGYQHSVTGEKHPLLAQYSKKAL
jgi:hypothetical protein|tara:strand:+ start:533 stop:853 length:321 start_codon:yes stop_codon:yes gene_type:complete